MNTAPEDPQFNSDDEWRHDNIPAIRHEILPPQSNVVREVAIPESAIQEYKDKIALYEGVLRAIASITKVETSADQSAEAFFFVASKMRKMAIAALQKTGAM